jgi:hypothetical protein
MEIKTDMNKYKYKQNDFVRFDDSINCGNGRIVGVSFTALPIMGNCYMVKVLSANFKFPNEEYPFDTISVWENNLSQELNYKPFSHNNGIHDTEIGPCACGAWHDKEDWN